MKCLVMCVTLGRLACVLTGGGRESERASERHRQRNIQRSRSAVRPQLECRATPVSAQGLSLSFSLSPFCLSLSVQLDSQPPTQSPPPRSRPVQPSHAWPSLGIHSGCFLFIASTPLSSFSFRHSSLCYLPHNSSPFSHALDFYLKTAQPTKSQPFRLG